MWKSPEFQVNRIDFVDSNFEGVRMILSYEGDNLLDSFLLGGKNKLFIVEKGSSI